MTSVHVAIFIYYDLIIIINLLIEYFHLTVWLGSSECMTQ